MPALGDRFRAAREARGLTLSDVAEQIRIRSVYLGAIEEESWASIGAPVYTRGFLRTYARFLGLDPEKAVASFNAVAGDRAGASRDAEDSGLPAQRERPAGSPRGLSPAIWAAAVIAVLLVAYVAYNAFTLNRQAAPLAVASPTAPASGASSQASAQLVGVVPTALPSGATPLPQASGARGLLSPESRTLSLRLSAPSWLRVTVDGSVSIEGTFPAGTTKTFHGKSALVRVGNAGGVQIFVDGKPIGTLGKSGDVVERSFTL